MSIALMVVSLAVALFLLGSAVASVVALLRHHLHPWGIGLHLISIATSLGILSVMSIVPDAVWWLPWAFVLAALLAAAIACRRVLTRQPPAEPTKRQASHLAPPTRTNLVGGVVLYAVLLGFALAAG